VCRKDHEEIVEVYCKRQSNNNYVGNCPWHGHVSRSKQSFIVWYDHGNLDTFRCWGCDEKGSAISQDEVDDLENRSEDNIKSLLIKRLQIHEKKYRMTEAGNAQRFVDKYSDRIHFCVEENAWYYYDGTKWTSQNGMIMAKRFALEIADDIRKEGKKLNNDMGQTLLKWANQTESSKNVNSMLSLASIMEEICINAAQFNQDIYLFNCKNGTLDLRTGLLRQHDPKDYITDCAPVDYDADAQTKLWTQCLDQWMLGNTNKIIYLQNLMGICLTGDRRCRVFPIFIGNGKNGKNIFLETISGVLGSYSGKAPEGLLVKSKHPKYLEIMTLKGKRMTIASESEEGMRIDTRLVKEMTGDKEGTGRYLYQDFVTFSYTHKCILMTNHEPIISSDKAMWDRIHKVNWDKVFTEKEQDRMLGEKMVAEYSGILNWLLVGCKRWIKTQDLIAPPEIIHSTKEYQNNSNPLKLFLDECCDLDPDYSVRVSDIYEAYQEWSGNRGISKKKFGMEMKNLGHEQEIRNLEKKKYRCWKGLTLNDDGQSYLSQNTYFVDISGTDGTDGTDPEDGADDIEWSKG